MASTEKNMSRPLKLYHQQPKASPFGGALTAQAFGWLIGAAARRLGSF